MQRRVKFQYTFEVFNQVPVNVSLFSKKVSNFEKYINETLNEIQKLIKKLYPTVVAIL